jgi:hypothetical protein
MMENTKSLKTKNLDRVLSYVSIPKKIDKMLRKTAKTIGIRYNPLGVLLEMFADNIFKDAHLNAIFNKPSRIYAKISEEDVRSIRSSRMKHIAIAAKYFISESMVSKIKSHKIYAWVKG